MPLRLAQADVGLAMNSGTMAAKEAANMIDLDSDPTKLLSVISIGKQLLITRGALTTFSIANDIAKYFAIIPAMFILAHAAAASIEYYASGFAGIGDLISINFQCYHHPAADPDCYEGREVPFHDSR